MHIGEETSGDVQPVRQAARPAQGGGQAAGQAKDRKAAPSSNAGANNGRDMKRGPTMTEERQQVRAVKSAAFDAFDGGEAALNLQDMSPSNFDLINDIPLQVMVELGRTKKSLGEVLNFGVGSIIVLDKQAGEVVDVIVNGKRIAKGEVVVVDENYGVRITELLKG